jgi:hypothetical protein
VTRGRGGLLGAILLLAALLGPVAALVVAVSVVPDGLAPVTPPPKVLTLPVSVTTDSESQAVEATLHWGGSVSLLAPTLEGIVTAVDVAPGSLVTSGTPLFVVDGVTVIALRSPEPFYEPIGPGSEGPEVVMLRHALYELGIHPTGTGDRFDPELEAAIGRLYARLDPGVALPRNLAFNPSWVVWLPVASLHVASVAVTVGESPPAPGAVAVSSTKQLEPFSLTTSAVGGVPETLPASSAGFALTLSAGPTVPVGPGFRVSAPGALATVAKVLGSGATSLTGTIALVHPRRYTTVVTSAVVADAAGQLCVFTVSSGQLRPILVDTHGGPPGEVAVTGLPPSVQEVVANPAQVARGRSC